VTAVSSAGLAAPLHKVEAKEARYKDYPLEIGASDQVVFQLVRGSVKLVGASSADDPVVLRARKTVRNSASESELAEFERLSFSVRRVGSAFVIEPKGGPEDRSTWSAALESSGGPELHFELVAPSVPVEVSIHSGDVQAQDWKENLLVTVVNGKVNSKAGGGTLKVQIQRGEVRVEEHRGNVTIDSYAAKVAVSSVRGDVAVSNFAGDSVLTEIKGHLNLIGTSGAMNITKSSGSADFSVARGALAMTGFEGPIKGFAAQGAVTIAVLGQADVQIVAEQAPVTVKLPSNSGARLNLQTDEGFLRLPDPIQRTLAGARRYSGYLQGTGDRGGVSVKSKSGLIRVQL